MCLPGTAEIVRKHVEADGAPKVDRRTALLGAAGAALAASFPASALANESRKRRKFCDLTHTFREGFPVFVTGEEPQRETIADYATSGFYAQKVDVREHSCTHMDVPGTSARAALAGDHARGAGRPDRRHRHQQAGARRPQRDGRAGRHQEVRAAPRQDSRRARSLPLTPAGRARPTIRTPSRAGRPSRTTTSRAGARKPPCSSRRSATSGIGIDTLSLDPGNSLTFPVHVNYLATDRYGIENLTGLDCIPRSGATAYVGLIPWEEGSGGPCRVIATPGSPCCQVTLCYLGSSRSRLAPALGRSGSYALAGVFAVFRA